MKKLFFALSMTLLALVYACASKPPPEPSFVEVFVDAGPDADDWPDPSSASFPACARACKNLKRLGCEEALPFDGGMTCYNVCAHHEQSNKFTLRPDCVAEAQDRSSLRACKTVRCGLKP